MPTLSIILPSRSVDDASCQRLLTTFRHQTFQDYEVLVETEGDSEEAKARAILKAKGTILGFFCTDNDCVEPTFLETMVRYASDPVVVGAYTAQYAYIRTDPPLTRYFALLGANDPLCWWLKKSDRQDYRSTPTTMVTTLRRPFPSAGDNGCFFKRECVLSTVVSPETFGSCMDLCVRLASQGQATYWVVSEQKLWHRTGDDWVDYFRRRYRYVKTLYFQKQAMRRWHMVDTLQDWLCVIGFTICSLLLLPQVFVSIRGYRRVKDAAWFLHPVVCCGLTFVYAFALGITLCESIVRKVLKILGVDIQLGKMDVR